MVLTSNLTSAATFCALINTVSVYYSEFQRPVGQHRQAAESIYWQWVISP